MLKLISLKGFIRNLNPVTSMLSTDRSGGFHENGLFSERIFGPEGSKERRLIFSYIELNAKIIHPAAYRIILQLDKKIEKFLSTERSFILDEEKKLVMVDRGGVTGIKEFIKMFPKIKFRGETETRDKLIDFLKKENKRDTIFLDKLPVIPPDLRPALRQDDGNWMIDPLNDVYLTVMRRASQVRSSGSGPLYDLLNYALQNAILEHDNFIRSKISKKSGIVRKLMLGKRVDFSGRAVISPGPEMKTNEAGIPLRMAVGLFEPFLMHRLLYSGKVDKNILAEEVEKYTGLELSVDSVKKIIKSIKEGDKIPVTLYELFYEATEVAMKGRVIVLKRDPVLQTQSYLGYNPVLHRGNTILMSTVQVEAHNADFDGDTVAVFHPLTDEAQTEAREKMMRLTSGTSSRKFAFDFKKEMWGGFYILTKNKKVSKPSIAVTTEELQKYTGEIYRPVRYRGVTSTAGRAIFNSCLPKVIPFVNEIATKKVVSELIEKIFNKLGQEVTMKVIDRLKEEGFKWVTIGAPSLTLDTFELPKKIYVIKDKLKTATPEEAEKLLAEAQKIVEKELKDTGFGDLVESGSTKGWGQPMQILVAKGIIGDSDGNILDPISGSFADGLTNVEYFNASQGARKGTIDRVINTADTGYMSRKLAYLLNTVEINRNLKDCGTKRTLDLKLTADLLSRLSGRYVIKNGKLMTIEASKVKVGDIVNLRSPVFCKSAKICHTCYGKLLNRHRTPFIGILASQIIGERGTQLIMRSFHTGGAVTLIKREMLNDIINNDPLSGLEV
jgi:DNA-directed RNA polymerase subunit beta'